MAWFIKEWLYNSVWVFVAVSVIMLITFWLDVLDDHNAAGLVQVILNNSLLSVGVVLLIGAVFTAASYKKER